MTSLAQIVAALSVTYSDAGVLTWLASTNYGLDGHSPSESISWGRIDQVARIVRCIGDADPDDFTITDGVATEGTEQ